MNAGHDETAAQIGLVPLIDLSLTLVVVFLVFMPMAMTSLMPVSSSGAGGKGGRETEKEAPLILEVTPAAVRVGPVSFDSELALAAWLKDGALSRRNPELSLKASRDVSQERLVRVLDCVRDSGRWKVTLLTLKDAP